MSLTLGTAPFSRAPAGRFNFDVDAPGNVIYLEPSPIRVRGRIAGETVVDSRAVRLLHETGHLPVWYFPRSDVREELLESSDTGTHCPYKGDATYHSVRVGDRLVKDAAWRYPEPLAGTPDLSDLVAFYFDRVDEWLEEDEPVLGHARDPYHRVDVLRSSRCVVVRAGDEVIAESTSPRVLFETGLPPRYYLPRDDVRLDLLDASDTHTVCPYKGTASYLSIAGRDDLRDAVWSYTDPLPGVDIAALLCFYDERVEIEVDGQPTVDRATA